MATSEQRDRAERAAPAPDGGPAGLERPVALGQLVRLGVAGASLAAAAIHASAISDHSFHPLHVLAFVAMAVFQAWWAYLALRSCDRRVLATGAVGHGAIVLLWLVSRTTGLPGWVPGTHGVEATELKDLLAVLLAVIVLAGIDVLSRPQLRARSVRPSRAGAAIGAFLVVVVLLGATGSIVSGHAHHPGHSHGHDPAHDHDPGAGPGHDH